MRLLFACALLVLCVSSGDALTCNFCMSRSDSCVPTTQTCPPYLDACASVLFLSPHLGVSRSCMNMATCQNYQHMPGVAATCCSTDNCN
ncbi:alpha-elapitoxin-As2a-like [Engraulis encrasicolus]|uniref:alpha-elapitoxin-As2a-like n=1 Tax=Engraulis encrasicolus TaxID=184585 RepID=UPI002FD0CBA7